MSLTDLIIAGASGGVTFWLLRTAEDFVIALFRPKYIPPPPVPEYLARWQKIWKSEINKGV